MKAAQGGGRVTYYCLVCCHCLARVGKMVKTSFDKSFEKKGMFGPQQIATKRIADGGEGQRSGHRAEKSWIQQRESGKQGLGKSLWIKL